MCENLGIAADKAPTGYEGGARKIHTTSDFDKQWYAGNSTATYLLFETSSLDSKFPAFTALKCALGCMKT